MTYLPAFVWILSSSIVVCYALDCRSGWFGPNCQYKCRCKGNNCTTDDGSCTSGSKCQAGWFGPACQYEDLAQSDTMMTLGYRPLSLVIDGNEDTCLGTSTREMSVKWAIPYHITWLRVHMHDTYLMNRFAVKFKTDWNRQIPCRHFTAAKVSDKALDIHCDLNVTVTQVIVSWEGPANLCSLYISGGRNIALNQNATQSSTDVRHFRFPSAAYAVDGDTESDYFYGHCAQTDKSDPFPKWSVEFSRNFTVNRYLLYHKIDAHSFLRRSYWFTLQGLTMDGEAVFTDKGAGSTRHSVYRVTTGAAVSPVAHVTIQSAGNRLRFTAAPPVLSLCEVEVYGETICEPGLYGRDCEHRCNCADRDEICFVSTGGCTSACATGFYGEGCSQECPPGTFGQNCSLACSQLCLANSNDVSVCHHVTGTCLLGCQVGFEGSRCNRTCTPGTYGHGCSYECSKLCAADGSNNSPSCHHLHGVCLHGCQPGYTGRMCNTICPPGQFGHECSLTCPEFCQSDNRNIKICDHVRGRCLLGCRPGYGGTWCNQTCTPGLYGPVCRTPCPQLCTLDSTSTPACHHVTGLCVAGCQPGYTGEMCDTPCQPGLYGPACNGLCPELCAAWSTDHLACHHVTGVCLRGCATGYTGDWCNKTCDNGTHGEECSLPCPQFCDVINMDESVCHHVHGTCLQGCQDGYQGPACNKSCDSGTFGQDCSFVCPQFCQASDSSKPVCHHVTGACLQGCQDGYTGSMCSETCAQGTFGPGCSQHCSQFCAGDDSICDPVIGTCQFGCQSGYRGRLCNEKCSPGKFGLHCKSVCSTGCVWVEVSGPLCNIVNGSCLYGCLEDYDGHNCTKVKMTGNYGDETRSVWVIVTVLGVTILAATSFLLWWRRRQIRSHMFNIAIHVRIKKSSSTENIIHTGMSDSDDPGGSDWSAGPIVKDARISRH